MVAAVIIILFAGFMPAADASEISDEKQYAIDMINWIRLDPLGYARGMGYDDQTLTDGSPWLSRILEQGLPLLTSNEYLQFKAAGVNDLSGETPLPGTSPVQAPAETGCISGVVTFFNFIDPLTAVRIVIDHQFRQELDPAYSGRRVILNRYLDLAGADFRSGGTGIDGSSRLAYHVSVVLESSVSRVQRQVLNLINQARHDPFSVTIFPDLFQAWGVQSSSPPLFFHDILQAFAATALIDTPDYISQAHHFGYPGFGIAKASVLEIFPKTDPDTMVAWLFSAMILNEAKGKSGVPVIFERNNLDAAVRLDFVSGQAMDHARLTLIAGHTEKADQAEMSKIYGLVYSDVSQDGIYTPGEGISGRRISIFDQQTFQIAATTMTDDTGCFVVNLPRNRLYAFQIEAGGSLLSRDLYLTGPEFVALPLPVEYPVP